MSEIQLEMNELSRKKCIGSDNGKAFRNGYTQEPSTHKASPVLLACISSLLASFTDRFL